MKTFIHHETVVAVHGDQERGLGSYDVIETDDGFDIYEQSMAVSSADTLDEAMTEAQSLADAYDRRHLAARARAHAEDESVHRARGYRPNLLRLMSELDADRYVLLYFPGPFDDRESLGVAVGKVDADGRPWLTAIWAGTTAQQSPIGWLPLPA